MQRKRFTTHMRYLGLLRISGFRATSKRRQSFKI